VNVHVASRHTVVPEVRLREDRREREGRGDGEHDAERNRRPALGRDRRSAPFLASNSRGRRELRS
jgi:hypothetical protein